MQKYEVAEVAPGAPRAGWETRADLNKKATACAGWGALSAVLSAFLWLPVLGWGRHVGYVGAAGDSAVYVLDLTFTVVVCAVAALIATIAAAALFVYAGVVRAVCRLDSQRA